MQAAAATSQSAVAMSQQQLPPHLAQLINQPGGLEMLQAMLAQQRQQQAVAAASQQPPLPASAGTSTPPPATDNAQQSMFQLRPP